jgi:hypothetical protein
LADVFTVTDKPVEEWRELAKEIKKANPDLSRKEINAKARAQHAAQQKNKPAEAANVALVDEDADEMEEAA